MKKLVVGLAAAVVVVLGLAGGTVLAQSAEEDGEKKSFAERVAEILGLEADTVEDALNQAKSEMREERTDTWLDKAVEAEKITQEEADAYGDWLDDRPEGVGEWLRFSYNPNAREDLEAKLDEAVEAEKITQEQADAHLERFDEKVEAMDENFKAMVDKAVEAEKMTQDEADSLNEWYDEKPDGVFPGFGGRGKFGYGRSSGHGRFGGKGGFRGRSGGGWHMNKGNKSTDATPAVEGSSA